MIRRKLTAEDLRAAGACTEIVAALEAEWPNGAIVTRATCRRAAELGADFDWAAENLLTPTAREAYKKATATGWEAYEKARATGWEAYEKARATAREAYEKATATAFWRAWRIRRAV